MKSTVQWLDAIKRARGLPSDYAVAKELGVSCQVISHYRAGRRAFDPYMAARVAEILKVDPMKVIASVEAERARNDEQRAFWRRLAAAVVLPVCAAAGLACPTPADARTLQNQNSAADGRGIQIMRTRRRRLAGVLRQVSEIVMPGRRLAL